MDSSQACHWDTISQSAAAGVADLCMVQAEPYPHRYPYDWRSKQPVIFRATEQWFASVDGFKQDALQAIKGVRWLPASGLLGPASRSCWTACVQAQMLHSDQGCTCLQLGD